ncbi:hypothetical protein ACOSP7_005147 [Xanthoceras sorbifolium]
MAENGKEKHENNKEPFGPWLVVYYGRNSTGFGNQGRKNLGGTGTNGNRNAGKNSKLANGGKGMAVVVSATSLI